MKKGALGIIETYGYLGAIEGADQAIKAANVTLIGCEKVRGGLVAIELVGDVAAVKVAVESGVAAVERLGIKVYSHVIPRPIEQLWDMLPKSSSYEKEEIKTDEKSPENALTEEILIEENPEKLPDKDLTEKVITEEKDDKVSEKKEEIKNDSHDNTRSVIPNKPKNLSEMKVVELRRLARKLKTSIPKPRIKYATKDQLIKAITQYYESEGDK